MTQKRILLSFWRHTTCKDHLRLARTQLISSRASLIKLQLDIVQVTIGTNTINTNAATHYQDIMDKLSSQLVETESIKQNQLMIAEKMDRLMVQPGGAQQDTQAPPPYSQRNEQAESKFIQIRASCYRRSCRPWCSCRCHVRRNLRTPATLEGFVGSLFVGYSGMPVLTSPCDEKQCRQRSGPRMIVSYQFPQWFWTRALYAAFVSSRMRGPEMLIRVQNKIPYASETYQHCLNGELNLLKNRFDDGFASPFDVDPDGMSLLHVSRDPK